MNYRIVELPAEYPDLLLHRDVNDMGGQQVVIMAIGTNEENDDYFGIEVIGFENKISAQNFISDFSKNSAKIWCEGNNITY